MNRPVVTLIGAVLILAGAGVAHAQPKQGIYGVSTRDDALYFVDPVTAQAELIGPLELEIQTSGIDFSCDGVLWGFSQTNADPSQHTLYTVDLATGKADPKRIFITSQFPNNGVGFEFGADEGTFLWRNDNMLWSLDMGTGAIIPLGTFGGTANNLTVSPSCDGSFLAVEEEQGLLVRINADFSQTVIGPTGFVGAPRITSLASVPDGRVYGHRMGQLWLLDTSDGSPTLVGNIELADGTSVRTAGIAWGPSEVTCSVCPFECPPTLDFEKGANGQGLVAGQVIDDEFAAFGITVSTNSSSHPAMIFDSSNPTCGDRDIGTPNKGFSALFPGAPGEGSGGAPGSFGRNGLPRGNVLILSEGGSCAPDDLAGGGTFVFEFDPPVPVLTEVHILDVEGSESGQGSNPTSFTGEEQTADDGSCAGPLNSGCSSCNPFVKAFDPDGNLLAKRPLLGFGNNSFQVVPVGARNVGRLTVKLCGSGAISALIFCRDCGANFEDDPPTSSPLVQAPQDLVEFCVDCSTRR